MEILLNIFLLVLAGVNAREETTPNVTRSTRAPVFHGSEAAIANFPYFVAVERRSRGQTGGGSIISEYFVISAAHLFDDGYSPRSYIIRAGSDLPTKGGSKHNLEYYKIHPRYVSDDGAGGTINDIALIRLDKPFKFDKTRRPIPLYKSSEKIKAGTPATVVGLGLTENGHADHLRSTIVYIADKAKCDKAWSQGGFLPTTPKLSICAGDGEKKRDTCNGDSGGPLVVNGTLVGITSYGFAKVDKSTGEIECGHPKLPGIYTEVSRFRRWIEEYVDLSSVN